MKGNKLRKLQETTWQNLTGTGVGTGFLSGL